MLFFAGAWGSLGFKLAGIYESAVPDFKRVETNSYRLPRVFPLEEHPSLVSCRYWPVSTPSGLVWKMAVACFG